MMLQGMVTKATRNFTLVATVVMVFGFLSMSSFVLAAGDTWAKKADIPSQRWSPTATAVDGKIYVIGGGVQGATVMTGTLYKYDPATDKWETKKDIPTPRSRHAVCAVNGKIYVIGGTPQNVGDDVLATVEEYDPATDTWTKKADMPTPRHSLTTSVVDGKIYAIGGEKGSVPFGRRVNVPALEIYDPVTDTWEKGTANPGWCYCTADVIRGKIYLAGMFATYIYNPATDTWTNGATMPTGRAYSRGAVVNDRLYVISGYNASSIVAPVVEVYDPVTDTWTNGASMLTPRAEFGIAVVDDRIYTFGGCTVQPNNWYSTVEEYTPEGWPFGQEQSVVSPQGKMAMTWGGVKSDK